MAIVLSFISGYLLGSIPNGLWIGRTFWQIDLREHGSKNIGATNAYRILGSRAAAAVFALDLLKGMAGVWLGMYWGGDHLAMISGGVAAIVGHSWSVFLRFSGGKGVATGLGVLFVLMPEVTAAVFVTWCVVVYITRYVSLASIIAAALVPVLCWALAEPAQYLYLGIFAASFVIYRHKANIGRLLNGTESKIKAGHVEK